MNLKKSISPVVKRRLKSNDIGNSNNLINITNCCLNKKINYYFFTKKPKEHYNLTNTNIKRKKEDLNLLKNIKINISEAKEASNNFDYSKLIYYIRLYNDKLENFKLKYKYIFDDLLKNIQIKKNFEYILYSLLEKILNYSEDININKYFNNKSITMKILNSKRINSIDNSNSINNIKLYKNQSTNTSPNKIILKKEAKYEDKCTLTIPIEMENKINQNSFELLKNNSIINKSISSCSSYNKLVEKKIPSSNIKESKFKKYDNKEKSNENIINNNIEVIKEISNDNNFTNSFNLINKNFIDEKDFEKELKKDILLLDNSNNLNFKNTNYDNYIIPKKTNNNSKNVSNNKKRTSSDFFKSYKYNNMHSTSPIYYKSKSFINSSNSNIKKSDRKFNTLKDNIKNKIYISQSNKHFDHIHHFDIDSTTRKKKN